MQHAPHCTKQCNNADDAAGALHHRARGNDDIPSGAPMLGRKEKRALDRHGLHICGLIDIVNKRAWRLQG